MKKFLLKSFLFSIILCLCLTTTYFLIKSRSTSKSTTDSDTSAIYANSNDTLTAAKRNTLVDKTQWKDMDINDTTTQFNTNCERRWKIVSIRVPISMNVSELRYRWDSTYRRVLKYTNKKQVQQRDTTTNNRVSGSYKTVLQLQYRCP